MGHRGSPRGRWKRERRDAKDQTAQVDADGSASPVKRPCLDCGTLTERTRCPAHERQQQQRYDARRGGTTQRGYGSQHQSAREQLAATLPRPCGYCGVVIHPGERWDAAHVVDGHPEYGLMVAHPVCNQRAKSRGAGVVGKLGKVAS